MAKFSKGAYVAIASALRDAVIEGRPDNGMYCGTMMATKHLADWLQVDNPAFNREHFLAVVRGEREPNSKPPKPVTRCRNCGREGTIRWQGAKGHRAEAYCIGCNWVLDPQPPGRGNDSPISS